MKLSLYGGWITHLWKICLSNCILSPQVRRKKSLKPPPRIEFDCNFFLVDSIQFMMLILYISVCAMFPLDYIWLNCCILNLLEFVAVQNGAMGHVIRSSAWNTWGPGKKWGLTLPIRITLMDRWKTPRPGCTLPKSNMEAKNDGFRKESPIPVCHLQVLCYTLQVMFPNEKPEFYWKIKWLFGNLYSTFPVSASSFLAWQTQQFGLETSKHIKSTSSNIHFILRKQLIYIYTYINIPSHSHSIHS